MQQSQKLKVKSLFGKYEEFPIDWQIKTFDELFKFLRTGSNSRDDLQEAGDIYYIHYGDIHAKWDSVLDCDLEEIPRIDKAKVQGLPFLKEGDLIIADASEDYEGSGASVLLRNIKNRNIVSGLHTIALRNIDENISLDFKTYLNSINFVKKQIIAYVTGISVYGLSKNNLKKIRIPLPPIKEQQKIASSLSNVDELIQKTEQIIKQTQRLKKGLMQRLLTKGIGHTKFKKTKFGEIPEEWTVSTIHEFKQKDFIYQIQDGNHGGLYPRKKDFSDKGKIFLTANSITDDGHIDVEKSLLLPEEYCKKLRIGFAKAGDVLFTHNATVGRVSILSEEIGDCILGTSVTYYRLNISKIDRHFFVYLLQSQFFKHQLNQVMFQSTRAQVPITTQARLTITLPSLPEQQKISSILLILDKYLQFRKLEKKKFKNLKKGLMQQLLTGKIRVKV